MAEKEYRADMTVEEFEAFAKTKVDDNAWVRATQAPGKLRGERNDKLKETDWWILRGNPTQAQLDYRQALRDITKTAKPEVDILGTVLTGVDWPTKPED